MAKQMKGTQKELDDFLSRYEVDSEGHAMIIMLFEIVKELKRLRMTQ